MSTPEYQAAWYKKNRTKLLQRAAAWRKDNIEKKRESDRQRVARDPQANRDRAAAWYAANRERALEQRAAFSRDNHDHILDRDRRYWCQNKNKRRSKNTRRRARTLSADRGVTAEQIAELFALYRGRCAYCAEPCEQTLDHVVPLSRGGLHEIGNLLPACKRCNSSKGTRTLDEWIGRAA